MDADRKSNVKQWIMAGLLGVLTLICGVVYSIQGPFYPIEAQNKGISVAMIGFIYGIYELISFLASPVVGTLMTKMGPAAGLYWGLILTALGTLGLGFISFVYNSTLFIVLSVFFRIVQSIGATFRAIAILSMATFTFQHAVATALASLESMFGIGMCVGVLAGGALMEVTGYKETFISSGALILLTLPPTFLILRKCEVSPKELHASKPNGSVIEAAQNGVKNKNQKINNVAGMAEEKKKITVFTLMRVPQISVCVFALVSSSISLGFIMGVMGPHLKQFNLSPFIVGLMFLYPALSYVIASPTLGYLYDKIKSTYYVQYVGPLFLFVSFSMIGPAPFVPVKPSTWLTAIGLILLGVAISSSFVSSFLIALKSGKEIGTPEDELKIHELISGIWRSAISLGLFVGPSVAGILYEAIGFQNESLLIIALQIIHIGIIILCGFVKKTPQLNGPSKNEGL